MSRKRNRSDITLVAPLRGAAADTRLSISSLRGIDGIEDAATFLARRISKAGNNAAVEGILRDLSSMSDILALLLSSHGGFRASVSTFLTQSVTFPTTKEAYITSIHSVILITLREFFSGVTPTTDVDSTQYHKQITSVSSTHQRISEIIFPTASPTSPAISLGFTLEPRTRRRSSAAAPPGKQSPKRSKHRQSNYRKRRRHFDDSSDEDENTEEVKVDDDESILSGSQNTIDPITAYYETVTALLDDQRRSLEYFFDLVLSSPSMGSRIREVVLKVVAAPTGMDYQDLASSHVQRLDNNEANIVVPSDNQTNVAPNSDYQDFPRISPGKAKTLFDSPDGWGPWHLFLSSNAIKDLRGFFRTDRSTYDMVQQKMKQLSDGFFSKSNQKLLVGGPNDVHFYEAKLSRDLRLVYRVELSSNEELKVIASTFCSVHRNLRVRQLDRQVLFIYGLYTHNQLDRKDFWNQVAHHSPRSDPDYRQRQVDTVYLAPGINPSFLCSRCDARARPIKGGANVDNMIPPIEWPHGDYPITVKPSLPGVTDEDLLDLHKITSLEKFIPWSRNVLESKCFYALYPCHVFSTLFSRIAVLADVDAVHRFAVSPTETSIINHDSSCFVVGRSGTGKTTTMTFKMLGIELAIRQLPRLWDGPRPRQMFITQSRVLAQRVQDYYHQLFHAAQFVQSSDPLIVQLEGNLLQMDEEDDERVDLPSKFSLLEDKHFPLFVTFDQLRRMLECDLDVTFARRKLPKRGTVSFKFSSLPIDDIDDLFVGTKNDSQDSMTELRSRFVSFKVFLSSFWSHFDQRITKGLDPALVFSEIMGVISGHETVAESELGYLDRESYISLSHRSHSALFHHREQIYQIFERYVELKHTAGMYDTADRTHAILRALKSQRVGNIDFLYVDEVQDLRIIDTKLLGELCPNPHGKFWGGDTAQTISVGSAFRFEELKALMYHAESQHQHVLAGLRPPTHPSLFQLVVNYRSHGGIVDCAASIVELLATKFPGSIDRLRRETALVTGPKPVLFRSNTVPFEEFMGARQGSRTDFGAEQVIIVRDEEARRHLGRLLGDFGTILTLLESKGLEFDDVLLYNFFSSSPASTSKWRVVHSDVRDMDKYRTVEGELKRLYVALTRARYHCWIWEQAGSNIPMIDYWTQANLIQIHHSDDPIPKLATESSPERWHKIGMELFARKLFTTAASCFGKAGKFHEQQICYAFRARETASDKASYLVAGAKFKEVAAAESTMSLGLFKRAGECFRDGGDYSSAAEAFESAKVFTEAARLYRKAGRFVEAVDLVKREPEVDSRVREAIIEIAKLEFVRTNNLKEAAIVFDNNVQEELNYMEIYGFGAAKSALHQQLGDFEAAGTVHEQAGETLLAVKCFLQSQHHSVRRRAIPQVLERLRSVAFHTEFSTDSQDLLNLLEPLDATDFDEDENMQLSIFRAITSKDSQQLRNLAQLYQVHHFCRLLCQDQALRYSPTSLKDLKPPQLLEELALLSDFIRSLTGMICSHDSIVRDPHATRLFGIRTSPNPDHEQLPDHYVVNRISFLGRAHLESIAHHGHRDSEDPEILLPATELDRLVRRAVAQTLRVKLESLHDQFLQLSIFKPCIDYSLRGSCGRFNCDRDHEAIGLPDYPDLIVRAALWVVKILNNVFYLPAHTPQKHRNTHNSDPRKLKTIRNIWVARFFQVLQPLSHRMGRATAHHELSSQAHHILQDWISASLSSFHPFLSRHDVNPFFLSDVLLAAWTAYVLHDFRLPPYIRTTHTLFSPRSDLIRPKATFGVVSDLLCTLDREEGGESRLRGGVLAARYIVESGVQIDLQGFMVFLEHLALEIILSMAHKRGAGADGLVLPRSWAIRGLWQPITHADNVNLDLFFELLGILMSKIASGSGANALLHHRKEMPLSSNFRQLCLGRLCRLLVLLGRNLASWAPPKVLGTINGSLHPLLRSIQPNLPHRILRPFALARNWGQLEQALFDSSSGVDNDYLVALFYRRRPQHIRIPTFPSHVKIIWFISREDIFRALGISSIVPSASKTTYPEARTIRTSGNVIQPVSTLNGPPQQPSAPLSSIAQAEGHPQVTDFSTSSADPKSEQRLAATVLIQRWFRDIILQRTAATIVDRQFAEEKIEQSRTEREVRAATAIQLWYRSIIHKRSIPRDHLLEKNFAACVAHVSRVTQSSLLPPFYRYAAMVRGVLPHALCSLDRILAAAFDERNRTRKLLLSAKHQALEKTHGRMDELIAIIKETRRLISIISPGSKLFVSGDIAQLRAATKEVLDLGQLAQQQVPFQNLEALQQDLYWAYHGIVEEPQPVFVKKEELVSLNTEDLYGEDLYDDDLYDDE
ncbi:hypothetical protein DL93DRAFT_2222704 [Clavulina sp. PMI_390]|nr:hypothetical protein DL93DRAFT_2222704 [Clavulina sp. PMI_390]